MTSIGHRLRITLTGVMVALVASLGATATTGSALAATKHRSHHTTHHKRHHTSCIPQKGGGDNDADNHGGPSDGDGCM